MHRCYSLLAFAVKTGLWIIIKAGKCTLVLGDLLRLSSVQSNPYKCFTQVIDVNANNVYFVGFWPKM